MFQRLLSTVVAAAVLVVDTDTERKIQELRLTARWSSVVDREGLEKSWIVGNGLELEGQTGVDMPGISWHFQGIFQKGRGISMRLGKLPTSFTNPAESSSLFTA